MEKIFLLLILIVILSFGFGMATMSMDKNGNMSDCPFADTAAICPMSFAEHIAIFQSNFRAIPSKATLFTILAPAFLAVLYFGAIPRIYSPPAPLKLFAKNHLELPINKLLLALSDGIIQPKLYA